MNAIIMAAGLGSRFKELTKHHHKSLLPINGTPNLERTLKMLEKADIREIHIVTGYLHEQFDYLPTKFPNLNIQLHYNDHYADYNNRYSFQLAIPFFGDSYVIDADTVLRDNVFLEHPEKSTYFTILRTIHGTEWCPRTDANGQVISMEVTDAEIPSMSGISYWNNDSAQTIKSVFQTFVTQEQLAEKSAYWDDIPVALLDKLDLTTKQVPDTAMYEMDTQDNYRQIQTLLKEN